MVFKVRKNNQLACPECSHLRSAVKDCRSTSTNIWRRRTCLGCKHTYTTREIIHAESPDYIMVPKKEWAAVLAIVTAVESINRKRNVDGNSMINPTKQGMKVVRAQGI